MTFLVLAVSAATAAQAGPLIRCVPVPNRMTDERWAPGAVCLADGHTALIVGGFSYSPYVEACVASADLFDETSGTFVPVSAQMIYPRDFPGTALLPSGQVLIAGGYNIVLGTLRTAEIFDPATQTFHLLPQRMHDARELFSTTVLADGRVLLCGGFSIPRRQTVSSAEVFDPTNQTFTEVPGGMSQDRFGHAAVRLQDGRVLIVGGKHWRVGQADKPLDSAEIYDPTTNTFHTTAGSMAFPRDRPTATLLPDGSVLIAGGQDGPRGPVALERFDPKNETFTTLPCTLQTSRMAHSAVLLPSGDVLLAGGWSPVLGRTTPTTELFDPVNLTCTPGPDLPVAAHDMGLAQFADGAVLLAAGKVVVLGKESSSDQGVVIRSLP